MSELRSCPACRAPVRVVITRKGKQIFLNAEPVLNGDWVIDGDQGHRFRPLCDQPDVERFQVHYATCPRPAQLSRKAVAEAYQRTRKRVMEGL